MCSAPWRPYTLAYRKRPERLSASPVFCVRLVGNWLRAGNFVFVRLALGLNFLRLDVLHLLVVSPWGSVRYDKSVLAEQGSITQEQRTTV